MSYSKLVSRKTMAALAASSVALISAGAGAGVAFAADPDNSPVNVVSVADGVKSLKDMPAEGLSLTVHKRLQPDADLGLPNNGTVQNITSDQAKPIGKVNFTVRKVEGIDLTTNEGWQKAAALSHDITFVDASDNQVPLATATKVKFGDESFVLGTADTKATDDSTGDVTFSGKTAALYVVEESLPEGDVLVGGTAVASNKISTAAPFVVALPLTDPDEPAEGQSGAWMKHVHVYPKNAQTDVTKKVENKYVSAGAQDDQIDATQQASKTVNYTITTTIPKGEKTISKFQMIDYLDHRVTLTLPDTVEEREKVSKVEVEGVTLEQGLNPGQGDYFIEVKNVDPAPETNNEDAVGQYVWVTFTEQGLQKLDAKANRGKTVTWTLKPTLDASAFFGDGTAADIPNQASVIPNEGQGEWDEENPPANPPGNPSNKVVSKFGSLKIVKKSSAEGNKELAGAKFQLWTCDKPADDEKPSIPADAKQIAVDGKSVFETGADGSLTIKGLALNDWVQNSPENTAPIENPTEAYCLKEIQAPDGYELLPHPISFQLLTTQTNEDGTASYLYSQNVLNVPENAGFNLPLTGGKGVVPLVGLGGLLVLGAGGYAAVAAKRNRKTS